MVKAYITRDQAMALDFRNYRHLIEFLRRHCTEEQFANYRRLTVFNKQSIVFDKDFRFTFNVYEDVTGRGWNVFPYYQIGDGQRVLICDELETEFAETMDEVESLVKSILYYIRTRI